MKGMRILSLEDLTLTLTAHQATTRWVKSDENDIFDLLLDVEQKEIESKDKFCEDGHRNIKPRENQIKCKVCKNFFS